MTQVAARAGEGKKQTGKARERETERERRCFLLFLFFCFLLLFCSPLKTFPIILSFAIGASERRDMSGISRDG